MFFNFVLYIKFLLVEAIESLDKAYLEHILDRSQYKCDLLDDLLLGFEVLVLEPW